MDAIRTAHPKLGMQISDPRDRLAYWKYIYWTKGIPAYQYRKERISDILDIMDIKNEEDKKQQQNNEMNEIMGAMQW